MFVRRWLSLLLGILLAGCGSAEPTPTPAITIIFLATPTPQPTPTPTPVPVKTIWVDPALPAGLHQALMQRLSAFVEQASTPARRLVLTESPDADVSPLVRQARH